jgi:tRNA(adenine34) deaminase
MSPDELMSLALSEAHLAFAAGEVPVGAAVIDAHGNLLAKGQNRRERDEDPTAHAEIIALRAAGAALGTWRLTGCTLAVTLEPCPMCAGALVNARISTLIYACPDPKAGATGTLMNLCQDPRLNHKLEVISGIQSDQCSELLKSFFRQQRALGKK